jgi:MoaA/NifB/PqqE/SkfB family radical SAM enzyme
MKQLFYLPFWFFKAKFFGKQNPLQSVVFVSDKCNLKCKHCCVYSKGNPQVNTFEEVKKDLEYCYSIGSRFVDFEGGEPFLWKDETNPNDVKDINSLFRLAKEIGFFSVTVTTNAQINFSYCEADSIWVSLDGIGKYHDAIRGNGAFEKLVKNINDSPHPKLSVNMVVNSLNYQSVRETIEFAKNHKNIKSISINFHTPYPGTEDLMLDWETRKKIIDEIIELKKSGEPIMNSVSGLKLMKHNNFEKQCWVTNFVMVDHTKFTECQGKTAGICDDCGFCMAGEMHSIFKFKLDTIIDGMKLRIFNS